MKLFAWVAFAAASLFVELSYAQEVPASAAAASAAASAGVNVANVPDCAKVCLSNSTQYATDCTQIDVKCLCNSPSYVSALSCCLATNCNAQDQQTAIQFNVQECAAVNSTAPNFVGCSPFSLTTGAAGSSKTSSASGGASTDGTTISGDLASIPAVFTNTRIATATYAGSSLLTGSCTIPLFAQVTERAGDILEFPQVGCALNRGSCCPFDPNQYAGLTKCPADYATTSGACCPNGYSVYYTAIGAETPCASKATKTFLPATTVSGSQVNLITDTVFTRRYVLVKSPGPQLPPGAIAGITVNAVLFAAAPFFIVWLIRYLKRRKAAKAKAAETEKAGLGTGDTFPPIEPALDPAHAISEAPATSEVQSPSELASPEAATKSVSYHAPSSPAPAYEMPTAVPFEMPGSTYIHEHHPAYTGSQAELNPRTPPRSPPHSPSMTSTRSPVLSPSSPFRTDSPSNTNTFTITPIGSPRFREGTM